MIGWSQPCALASFAFSSLPTVPITVAPSDFAHWQAMRPTPPAAAWNRMVSPRFTLKICRIRYWVVMPLSIIAAACSSAMPLGRTTSRSAGMTRASAGPGLPTCTSSQVRTSGPPALWKRMAWVMTRPFLFQILLEEVRSPLVREVSGFLVVVLAADAGEGVIHAGIAVNGDVRVALERVLDLGLRRRRTELVLLGDMEHQRLLDRLGLVERALDADAVVADGGVRVGARRHQVGELAAEAVADSADLARAG